MSSGRVFKAQLGAWAERAGDRMDALARQVCFETASQVVVATPVDTGFLRGSWQPALNAEPSTDGGASIAEISLVTAGVTAGDVFAMRNNAAYALRVEFGFTGEDSLGRFFDQKGQFYVTRTLGRWPQIVSDVAADLGM